MTPLERDVVDALVRTNKPITSGDLPYPASLLPIAQEAIRAVRDHDAETTSA